MPSISVSPAASTMPGSTKTWQARVQPLQLLVGDPARPASPSPPAPAAPMAASRAGPLVPLAHDDQVGGRAVRQQRHGLNQVRPGPCGRSAGPPSGSSPGSTAAGSSLSGGMETPKGMSTGATPVMGSQLAGGVAWRWPATASRLPCHQLQEWRAQRRIVVPGRPRRRRTVRTSRPPPAQAGRQAKEAAWHRPVDVNQVVAAPSAHAPRRPQPGQNVQGQRAARYSGFTRILLGAPFLVGQGLPARRGIAKAVDRHAVHRVVALAAVGRRQHVHLQPRPAAAGRAAPPARASAGRLPARGKLVVMMQQLIIGRPQTRGSAPRSCTAMLTQRLVILAVGLRGLVTALLHAQLDGGQARGQIERAASPPAARHPTSTSSTNLP